MAEYIERDECRDNFYASVLSILSGDSTNDRANQIIDEFDTLPSADVEPVRCGHWICIGDIDEYIFECSECHEIYCLNDGTPKEHQYNYCPNCGTKLCKGEENNA